MTAVTVVKTIGTSSDFSTLQSWHDGAPANLVTSEKSAAGTFLVSTFTQGEALTFVGSGATGKFLDSDGSSYITYGLISGNPAASDVATGGTSGATCVLSSGTPTNVGIVWQGQCKNQEFTSATTLLAISGSTPNSTCYKELTTFAGASFRDNANAQTNALCYSASNGCGIRCTGNTTVAISCTENSVHINKLQIAITGSDGRALTMSSSSSCFVNGNILEGTYTSSSATQGVFLAGSLGTISNCLIIQRASGAHHIVASGTISPAFYNCTIAAPDDLGTAPTSIFFSGASGTVTAQNCSIWAGDTSKAIKAGSATYNFTTCYSDISGTTNVTQATYGSEFQNVLDATRDYRLKAGAAELDQGTTDVTNAATDIVGTSRPQGSAYDVSAWELVTTVTGGGPIFEEGELTRGALISGRLAA